MQNVACGIATVSPDREETWQNSHGSFMVPACCLWLNGMGCTGPCNDVGAMFCSVGLLSVEALFCAGAAAWEGAAVCASIVAVAGRCMSNCVQNAIRANNARMRQALIARHSLDAFVLPDIQRSAWKAKEWSWLDFAIRFRENCCHPRRKDS